MRAPTSRIPIKTEADITRAVIEANRLARLEGFAEQDANKLATAVSELVRNILKYAGSGDATISTVAQEERRGLKVVVRDTGPGIANIDEAMRDHFSSSGTLGLGLPGVKRMVDDFHIASTVGKGTTVTVHMWAGPARAPEGARLNADVVRTAHLREGRRTGGRGWGGVLAPDDGATDVECAYFIRPCLGERLSGDDVLVDRRGDHVLVLVVDGLGHGRQAHEAAVRAKRCLRAEWSIDPVANVQALHRELENTVGAAVGLAVFDVPSLTARYVGIGNTVMRQMGGPVGRVPSVEGTVGGRVRPPRAQRVQLQRRDTVLFYTDGVSDRFDVHDVPQVRYEPLPSVVRSIVERYGKSHDDATCVAVRFGA